MDLWNDIIFGFGLHEKNVLLLQFRKKKIKKYLTLFVQGGGVIYDPP